MLRNIIIITLRNIIIQLNFSYRKPPDCYVSFKNKNVLNFIVHNPAIEYTSQITKLVELNIK